MLPAAFPLCFASMQDFARWRDSKTVDGRVSHCRDCLPTFQLRMKKCGRCARPDVMFTMVEEGVVGIAP